MHPPDHIREVLEPYLQRLGLYTVPDPSKVTSACSRSFLIAYGRYTLPAYPPHLSLIDDPTIVHRYRRVFLRPESSFVNKQEFYDSTEIIHSEDVEYTKAEIESGLARGGRWICYSTWELPEPPVGGWEGGGRGRGRDLLLVHGA